MRPTQEELEDLSLACQRLWELDENRLEPDKHYDINVQEGKSIHNITDGAGGCLFAKVSDVIWKKPTFLIFYHLLDNYTRLFPYADACQNSIP
jgi:poly(U)-specific endoribonuclease